MTNTDTKGAAPSPPRAPPRATRIIYAGFICALGYAVLVIVLHLVGRDRFGGAINLTNPLVVLGALGVATTAFFLGLNGRGMAERLIIPGTGIGPTRAAACCLLGGVALVIAANGFWVAVDPSRMAPRYDQFAVALPAIEAKKAEDGQVAQPAREAAQLIWWVERDVDNMPSGLLPMFLGGVLTIGFGLWYPKVAARAAETALGKGEKLLAPILSLAMVALGVGQQAEAAKAAADVKYVQQGIPPVVRLGKQGVDVGVRILPQATLNPETLRLLQTQVEVLSVDIANRHQEQLTAQEETRVLNGTITARLEQLNADLRNPPMGTPTWVTKDDVVAVREALNGVNSQLGARTQTQTKELLERCATSRAGLATAAQRSSAQLKQAQEQAELYRKQRFRRAWIWLSSKPPMESGAKQHQEAAAALAEVNRRAVEIQLQCGVEPRVAG